MYELAEKVRASIENPSSKAWFPELSSELTGREWHRLGHDFGMTEESYRTTRLLSGRTLEPCEIISSVKLSLPDTEQRITLSIEAASDHITSRYYNDGINFYSREEVLNSTVLHCLNDAFVILQYAPSLMTTVTKLVRSVHLLKPNDDQYDVSFSEPELPFSIFVSVPHARIENDALRLAEGLVHEAMHLQLTLIEKNVAVFSSSRCKHFSPWRREFRNSQGLLHGLYVFRVIHEFFHELLANQRSFVLSQYISARRFEIASQLREIQSFQWCRDLTPLGQHFVKKLLYLDV